MKCGICHKDHYAEAVAEAAANPRLEQLSRGYVRCLKCGRVLRLRNGVGAIPSHLGSHNFRCR